jgi:CRISPR/Cas system-associated exonuclease Cas4 (RecB family)
MGPGGGDVSRVNINPSSAAFVLGDMVVTDTPQGCLRFLLLKKHLPREEGIPLELQVMGERGECIYMEKLLTEQPWPFHRELPFQSKVEGVKVRGRMDFVTYHDGFKVIHECKTSQSKTFLYDVIKKGKPKVNHIAQLVFYLIHLEETRGKLVTLYAPTMEEKVFKVEIKDGNVVYLNSVPYYYTVENQIMHQLLSAKVIKEDFVANRPWGKACTYCRYKEECDKYDGCGGSSFEDFL